MTDDRGISLEQHLSASQDRVEQMLADLRVANDDRPDDTTPPDDPAVTPGV